MHKVLDILGATGADVTAVCHGTTVATNKLLEGKVEQLGFITSEGYEFMLEIARQAVPDGYGNSYFWVKPPRIVPADYVKTVGGRLDFEGNEVRPFDEEQAVAAARWFKDRGITTIGVCFLHSYAATSTSCGCATSSCASTPTRSCRSPRRSCASTASTSGR